MEILIYIHVLPVDREIVNTGHFQKTEQKNKYLHYLFYFNLFSKETTIMDEISPDNKYSKEAVSLTTWDVVAVVLYFVTILSVGISVSILSHDESLLISWLLANLYESYRRGTFTFCRLITTYFNKYYLIS